MKTKETKPKHTPIMTNYYDGKITVLSKDATTSPRGHVMADLVAKAYNNTYAAGINPEAVPDMLEALEVLIAWQTSRTTQTDMTNYTRYTCNYCGESWDGYHAKENHAADCAYVYAKQAIAKAKETK